jgi:NADH:ubiquinone reductase (H+-translocating)
VAARALTGPGTRPRVVIVGGGFAGVSAAKALRRAPVDITLLDRTNHYLFQPLLYQVAAGLLSPSDIALPTRFLLRKQRNVDVRLEGVDGIDLAGRRVIAGGGRSQLAYDYLIVATGARHSYFGRSDWEPLAPGLKTLEDARDIRSRFLLAFERAETSSDHAERAALLTFVIVGGGPTGVELAGILPTIARRGIRADFRHIDPATARVVLLEAGDRLLPSFPEPLARRAQRDLQELGVDVRTGTKVTSITPEFVLAGDLRIPARTVFWAAGNVASPLIRAMNVPVDRAGRAVVAEDLSVSGHPEVFVVGDAAAVPWIREAAGAVRPDDAPPLVPGVAPAANQMGAHAASMIRRSLEGQPRRSFRYRDRGSLAIIGRGKAIADFGRLTLTGHIAFLTWLFVHILYLAGFRNRVSVALEWGYAYATYRPGARLISVDDRGEAASPDGS